MLQKAFTEAPNIPKVRTSFYVGKAPPASAIADASVIVILSSSDRAANEIHPLFPPDPSTDHHKYDDTTKAFLQGYDDLVRKKGMGSGGAALRGVGRELGRAPDLPRLDRWSVGADGVEEPRGPVGHAAGEHHASGAQWWQPWNYRDEVFSRFFLPEDYRRTDLVVATPEKDQNGIGPRVAAWAYQRDDGGRAFVFGGVDYHDAMLVDNYRRAPAERYLLGARGKVPVDGVQSKPRGHQAHRRAAHLPRRRCCIRWLVPR